MPPFSSTTALFAATLSVASAQLVYNNTQVNVKSTNQYSGDRLIGYHVGAGLSYIVAQTGSGNSFSFNLSAASAQLLDNDIAIDYQLPCYVINSAQISTNSGPLECGVGDQSGYYDVASVAPPSSADAGNIIFSGISQWYVCAVQSFTYGWVQSTIVGAFGSTIPSGEGVQNCTTIDGFAFVTSNGTSTTDSSTDSSSTPTQAVSSTATTVESTSGLVTESTSASASTLMPTTALSSGYATSSSQNTSTVSLSPGSVPVDPIDTAYYQTTSAGPQSITTVTVPCSTHTANSNATYSANATPATSKSTQTSPIAPIATYAGAACATRLPLLAMLLSAVVHLLL